MHSIKVHSFVNAFVRKKRKHKNRYFDGFFIFYLLASFSEMKSNSRELSAQRSSAKLSPASLSKMKIEK